MTRRDYCNDCKDRVSDNDPMCSKCGESYCKTCLDPTDELRILGEKMDYKTDKHTLLYCKHCNFLADRFHSYKPQKVYSSWLN